MPVELPKFDDGYGFSCCVCGITEAEGGTLKRRKMQVVRYDTPHGAVILRAWIDTGTKDMLRAEWAKGDSFVNESPPKVTTEKVEDVQSIIESAYGTTMKTTVCAWFRVPIKELPDRGIVRSMMLNTKLQHVSVQMTAASLALTGLPISRLRWSIVNPKEDAKIASVDLKGSATFTVSATYLSDVWRWIYEQFAAIVLGRGSADTASKTD